ncbi:DUF2807 domain-containing protein [Proteinivorax tanatarense]|uniref:DUF2807 domain-containing protein n=1 Tax=Proteinivorax tanatarense TaxID=1260629 RepID=A0AAU7VIE4_9FIRM
MRKIFENEEIAAYSDKDYLSKEGRYLKFEDGSEIDLYDYTITNYGKGEIDLVYLPQQPIQDDLVSKKILVGSYKSLYCSGGNVNIKILKSDVDDEYITVQGTEDFFNSLQIVENRGALNIYTKPNRDTVVIGEVWINGKRQKPESDPFYGEIIIYKSNMETFTIDTNGKGSVHSEVPIGVLDTKISGSFSMDLIEVEEAKVRISGSGDVKFGTLLNDSEFNISGSGKVIIQNGKANKIYANVSGSGDIIAMIPVNEAYLDLTGSGNIVIDQVVKFSREKRGGSGYIKVLRRG